MSIGATIEVLQLHWPALVPPHHTIVSTVGSSLSWSPFLLKTTTNKNDAKFTSVHGITGGECSIRIM